MRLSKILSHAVLLFSISFAPTALAAGPLTVGLVRQTLLDSIGKLDTTLANATGNLKAAGFSLEGNARGLISDIDARLGSKLDYTFDRLDKTERRLMEDAQTLIEKLEISAQAVIGETSKAATKIIGDADILAYNTLYSLPCRSQVPRLVYATPEILHSGYTLPEVTLRGNFLDLGAEPVVTVDGAAARVLGRTANTLHLQLPSSVFPGNRKSHSVTIKLRPTELRKRCLLGVLPKENKQPLSRDLTMSVLLHPPTTAVISATLTPIVGRLETISTPYELNVGTGNDCDGNFDATRTFCLPDGWGGRLVIGNPYSGPHVRSANGKGGIQSTNLAGDRCIRIEARVIGNGYDNYYLVKDCKGRGWLHYSGDLHGEREIQVDGPASLSTAEGVIPVRTNFILPYQGDLGPLKASEWRYSARLDLYRGDAVPIRTIEVSNVDPNVAGLTSRMESAALHIDLGALVAHIFEE